MTQYLLFTVPTVLIFIWLETDAFVEYALKLRIPLPRIKEYWSYKQVNQVKYADYLSFNANGFFTRLLACPYCLMVVTNILIYVPAYYRNLDPVTLCVNILLGWFVYPALIFATKERP